MQDNLEERAAKVREILLGEVGKVMNEVLKDDTELVNAMKKKGESALQKIDELCCDNDDLESFYNLAEDMNSIRLDVNPRALGTAFDAVKNAFMMNGGGGMNAKQFSLDIPSFEDDDFIEIKILRGDASPKYSKEVLNMIYINMECQVPGNPSTMIRLGSAGSRVAKSKGSVSEDENTVSISMRKPNNIIGRISVRVFGSHIVNSPFIVQFHHDEFKLPNEHNLTIANDTLGVSVLNLTLADMTTIIEEETLEERTDIWDPVSDDDVQYSFNTDPETESCFLPPQLETLEERTDIWDPPSDEIEYSFNTDPEAESCFLPPQPYFTD